MNPIAFALDVPTTRDADLYAMLLYKHVGAFKIGLELFIASHKTSWWPTEVVSEDVPVILDLKLHDIPETVARAVKAGGDRGAKYMTLHIQQKKTLELALKAAEPFGITLLGVTVLTSMDGYDLEDLCYENDGSHLVSVPSPSKLAAKLAKFAYEQGLRGFVCSPAEVKELKGALPGSFFLVPGVRPAGADLGDQVRVGTPKQAVEDGADLIVVGRPIRDASDPVSAAKAILAELG